VAEAVSDCPAVICENFRKTDEDPKDFKWIKPVLLYHEVEKRIL